MTSVRVRAVIPATSTTSPGFRGTQPLPLMSAPLTFVPFLLSILYAELAPLEL